MTAYWNCSEEEIDAAVSAYYNCTESAREKMRAALTAAKDIDTTSAEEKAVERAAVVVWMWVRHWWEPRGWSNVPVSKKGYCRLIAWAVFATLKRTNETANQEPPSLGWR